MAWIEELRQGQEPPPDTKWAMVEMMPSPPVEAVLHDHGATFYISPDASPAGWINRTNEAIAWAEARGFTRVYLKTGA